MKSRILYFNFTTTSFHFYAEISFMFPITENIIFWIYGVAVVLYVNFKVNGFDY